MQTPDTENQDPKMKGHEDSITFRPSPNFKHMKKYLKSKFEEENNLNADNKASESQIPSTDGLDMETTSTAAVQPPLPPNPPPPDSPINTNVKEEIDSEEAEMNIEMYMAENQTEGYQLLTQFKTDNSDEEIMCRNFIRGTCTRGDSCIFVHRVIISQLPSVYRFCNDFQNTVCNFRKCKFVHASVFEKEYFFRTGYLPPHTLSHLKEVNTVSQPPPPPPPAPAEGVQAQVTPMFNNPPPPPQIFSQTVAPMPVISCVPAANLETRSGISNAFQNVQPAVTSPQKRELAVVDHCNKLQQQQEMGELQPKRCKKCKITDFRVEYARHKWEKMVRASEEKKKKLALLTKRTDMLFNVVETLLKPLVAMEQHNTRSASEILTALLNEDPMKVTMEQHNTRSPTDLLTTILNQDAMKVALGQFNTRSAGDILSALLGEEPMKETTSGDDDHFANLLVKYMLRNESALKQC